MAKTVKISKAEYDVLVSAYAHDGLELAMLRAELEAAKRDIKQLLVIGSSRQVCEFCKISPAKCEECETCAEWRGWSDAKK